VPGQSIWSLSVTEPDPFPARDTVSVWELDSNVAVTAWSELIVTVQVPVPLQPPPDQPPKLEPESAVAVSVTIVPLA
jgi:hypothetical protein